mgnify:CR=1 FL=1
MHIRSLLSQRIEAAFTTLGLSGQALLQAASRPEFGDYQANGVMAAAKRADKNPREVAQAVIDVIDLDGIASNLAVAGPGAGAGSFSRRTTFPGHLLENLLWGLSALGTWEQRRGVFL